MKIFKYACLFSLLVAHCVMANQYVPDWAKFANEKDPSIHYGPTTINNEKLPSLTIYGPATITNTTVENQTIVKGPVEALHSNFDKIEISGIAKFEDVKAKELVIHGPIFASQSTLDNISVTADKFGFSNSKVTKLVVKGDGQSRVYLEKGATINSLVFESKKGIVVLGDSASHVDNLEGGTTESKTDVK